MTASPGPGAGGVSPPGAPGRSEPATAGPSRHAAPGEPGNAVLRCEGLRKRFGTRQAVDGISFEIARGETYGLLGPNGAGKTTTISMALAVWRFRRALVAG